MQMVQPKRTFKGAGLLVVDVQARLVPAIPEAGRVVARIVELVGQARRSGMPILASEQYSRGLGATLPEVRRRLNDDEVIEKIHFAAPRESAFRAALQSRGLDRLIVAGMEAHVCVLQSVLALLDDDVAVTVVGDAVASRAELNRRVALMRMARCGAELADTASVLAGVALSC